MSFLRRTSISFAGFGIGLALAFVLSASTAHGQKKKAEDPVAAPPQFPALTTPANLGLQRGTTVELTLVGSNLAEPTGVLMDPPLTATVPTDKKNGAEGGKLRVKVRAPADAPIGLYSIRVATRTGVSNFRPLVVDEFPEVAEAEGNKTKETAQEVPVPCVVLGRADPEMVDFFRVKVNAGQRLSFEVLGRRIGSPIDPIVVLHDGKTRREMVDLYADDTPGLQSDARLTHTFREAGEVIVEVHDSTYRGGPDYSYRLRIGEFPGATTAFPLALQRGRAAGVGFSGPGADAIPPVAVTATGDRSVAALYVSPRLAGGAGGWPVPVRLSDDPETVEREPNDDAATANALPVPGGISARFGAPNDLDYFKVAGKKGQKLAVVALANEVNAPTEVLVRVLDAKGAELARSNPALAAARVEFTPPDDGDYFVVCEHLNYLSGPNEVYHLSVRPAAPTFEFALPLDRAAAPAGGATALSLTGITRLNGFAGPIELSVVGDPVLSGTATVRAGETAAYLPLAVKAGTGPGAYRFHVRGRATVGGKEVETFATTFDSVKASFAGLPNPPLEFVGWAALAVVERPPFALTAKFDPPGAAKGKSVKLIVDAGRSGFDGEIALATQFVSPGLTVTAKPIAKGTAKVELEVAVAADAPAGPATVVLKGTAKVAGKDYAVVAVPAAVEVAAKAAPPKKEGPKPKEKPKA